MYVEEKGNDLWTAKAHWSLQGFVGLGIGNVLNLLGKMIVHGGKLWSRRRFGAGQPDAWSLVAVELGRKHEDQRLKVALPTAGRSVWRLLVGAGATTANARELKAKLKIEVSERGGLVSDAEFSISYRGRGR